MLHSTCFYFSAILSQAWAINFLKTLKEKLGLFWRAQFNDVALYTSPSFSCDWFLVKVTTETHCWSFCEQKTQFSALPSCRHMVWAVCPQQRYLMTLYSWGIFWPLDHENGVKRLVITNGLNPINLWHQTDACRWKAVTWNVLVSKAFLPPVPRLILMMTVYYMMPRSESVSNILSIVSDVNWVCIYYPYASGPLFMTPLSWQTINPLDLWARPGCVLISFELSIGSFWMSNEEAMIPSDSPSLSIPGGNMP